MTRVVRFLFFTLSLFVIGIFCTGKNVNSVQNVPRSVKQYCGSCHLIPEPQSLTKEVWQNSIFPKMSQFYIWIDSSRYDYANLSMFEKQGTIPMNDDTWSEMLNYYESYGLDSIFVHENEVWPIQTSFIEKPIGLNNNYPISVTAAMMTDERILLGNAGALVELDTNYVSRELVFLNKDITHIYSHSGDTYLVTTSTIDPHHGPFGEVSIFDSDTENVELVLKNLERPVQMHIVDDRMLISEFGFKNGKLSFREMVDLNKSKTIHNLPGSYRIIPAQLLEGEKEVLVTSVSQAQEGIYALLEKGGSYEVKELIRFKPEFGLSDIDIADINQDGLDDILVVNGDNADYSIIPKKYHGINIYLNRGNFKFSHSYSFKIHGATQGKIIDVNEDNRPDIVASCYFAEHKEQRIVLLENQSEKELSFRPYRFTNSSMGNWMIMEKGDINSDGRDDLLLGSYNLGPKESQDSIISLNTNILLLINQSDK